MSEQSHSDQSDIEVTDEMIDRAKKWDSAVWAPSITRIGMGWSSLERERVRGLLTAALRGSSS